MTTSTSLDIVFTPPAPAGRIVPVVVRHAEDAAFYAMQRNAHAFSPLLSFERLRHLDRVLDAHLDGLREAEEMGWECALNNLRCWRMNGESFAASVLMLESRNAQRFDDLWRVVSGDTERMLDGVISALGWIDEDDALDWITHWLNQADFPAFHMLALRALAIRRLSPDTSLLPFLTAKQADVRAAAALLVGRVRLQGHVMLLRALLQEDAALEVRNAAALSLHLLGDNETASTPLQQGLCLLNQLADSQRGLAQEQTQAQALRLACHLGHALPLGYPVLELAQSLPLRQLITLLAHHGNPTNVPWLINATQRTELARLAGWAVSMITGLDIEAQGLCGAGPVETEQDERTRPVSDPDVGLPWPDPAALQAWWQAKQGNFAANEKYLCGQAASHAKHCIAVLQSGMQAERYAAAIALTAQELPLFETRAACTSQLAQLAALIEK